MNPVPNDRTACRSRSSSGACSEDSENTGEAFEGPRRAWYSIAAVVGLGRTERRDEAACATARGGDPAGEEEEDTGAVWEDDAGVGGEAVGEDPGTP